MANEGHKHCYGTMFPDLLHVQENRPMRGKVFSFELDRAGLARSGRQFQSDLAEWDDCVQCPEFDHCYKFCMAKLQLQIGIEDE